MLKDFLKTRLGGLFGDDARKVIPRLLTTDGKRHIWGYGFAFLLMLVVAGTTALPAYLMKDVVNRIFVDQNYIAVWALGVALAVIFMVKGFAMWGVAVALGRVGNRVIADYQRRVYDNLLQQGLPFFGAHHTSDLMHRINSGSYAARGILDTLISGIGRDLVSLILLVVVMIVHDPVMALVGGIIMPVAVLGIRKLIKRSRSIVEHQFSTITNTNSLLMETIQGAKIVKAYNLEDRMRERMHGSIDRYEQLTNKMIRVQSRTSPLMETLGGLAVAAVVMYAGHKVLAGSAKPGEFFSVITALLLAYEPAKRLAKMNVDLTSNLYFARYILELIDATPSERESADKPKLEVTNGRIEFRNVKFSYRENEPVLEDISFVAEPGTTTALVGLSGAGKSTLISTIERFYGPPAGGIAIDGTDIASVSLRSLRNSIAYVGQDAYMFSGTIRDNIEIGKPGASDEEIAEAAKAAFAHDFISAFPGGYAMKVGEQGGSLSGGERARVTIARAFLKNSPILLLDEPTAALDSESERHVQRALNQLRASRTTIVIAHRLQTIVSADKICVIEKGRIVETGRHDELIARRGRYHTFYEMQFGKQVAALVS